MNVLNILTTALTLTVAPMAVADVAPPASLTCKVQVTLPGGDINIRDFVGVQDVGGSDYLLAQGLMELKKDVSPIEFYVFFDGRYSSINVVHEESSTYLNSDTNSTGAMFALGSHTPSNLFFTDLSVICHGVR